ncbi:glycine, glutamate and proline-rich protein-like [Crassostrea angulata]|uniref:glycine, glutamate and proline-rich protein-like n=1 Tax=Magallana angulata TaxID=2784310 RepID=UPI0022B16828|nr:glycine, glutamate and proline-rich protein-like [Crassostrea angulata]
MKMVTWLCVFTIITIISLTEGYNYSCFGDFTLLHPTGKSNGGVQSSQLDVSKTYNLAHSYKACFEQIGQFTCIHPAIIAAVASRETNVGADITVSRGWNAGHFEYGMLPCDTRSCLVCHKNVGLTCTSYPWNTCDHALMMAQYVLLPFVKSIQTKFPSWLSEQHIQGGLAAYNAGIDHVDSWSNVDQHTTHHDYSNDVIARAQYLVSHYSW